MNWTKPWGVEIAADYLGRVEAYFGKGVAELEAVRGAVAGETYHAALESEWRVARTLQSSLRTTVNLIKWIQTRDRFLQTRLQEERLEVASTLRSIALAERENARAILPLLQSDSRLGYGARGWGGLFNAELVSWKVGDIDDLLLRRLSRLLTQPPSHNLLEREHRN